MTKILIISRISMGHGVAGGMESGLQSLADGLKQSGFEVAILTTHGIVRPDLMSTFEHVWCLPFGRPGKYSLPWWLGSTFHRPSKQWDPNLTISISSAGAGFMFANKQKMTVAQCHGTAFAEVRSSIKTGGVREYAKVLLNTARIAREVPSYRSFTKIWAVSEEVANQLRAFPYRVAEEKIEVISNGVDVDQLRFSTADRLKIRRQLGIPTDADVGITLCRLVAQKGVDVAIRSLATKQGSNRNLIVAGDGPEGEALRALARDVGVVDRVRFVGHVEKSDVPAHLSAADVFVFPTRRLEGLPFSLLEALANGLPVLTTNGCNVPDDIQQGVHISDGSAEAISMTWQVILERKSSRLKSNLPSKYSQRQMAGTYARSVEDLLSLLEGWRNR